MDFLLHLACSMISLHESPTALALDVLAPLVECALNLSVSIPALDMRSTSHLATEQDATGLCGSMVLRSNWLLSILSCLFLHSSDKAKYASKHLTTHKCGSVSYEWKDKGRGA